jgi:hypothetical protein
VHAAGDVLRAERGATPERRVHQLPALGVRGLLQVRLLRRVRLPRQQGELRLVQRGIRVAEV